MRVSVAKTGCNCDATVIISDTAEDRQQRITPRLISIDTR